MKERVLAGWNRWRRVICDRTITARVKGVRYKRLLRTAMLYGLLVVALTKGQEVELEVAALKMLRLPLGVTKSGRIRN